jgi:hypothetical protein
MRASSTASARAFPALALACLLAGPLAANPLHDLDLAALDGSGRIALADYREHWLLLSFFEPECAWCHRQLKALEQLSARCSETLQALAVGINGRDLALRRELRRARVTFPAARGSAALLERTGEIPATPWTLLLSPRGEVAATLRGFVREEQLAAAFPALCRKP